MRRSLAILKNAVPLVIKSEILILVVLLPLIGCRTSEKEAAETQEQLSTLEREAQNLADENLLLRQQLEASTQQPGDTQTEGPVVENSEAANEGSSVPEDAVMIGTASSASIQIYSVIPNPSGNERTDEAVTLVNTGDMAVSLSGWRVKDLADSVWDLSGGGTIGPGQRVTVRRNGMSMGLNNDGDTVFLVRPDGEVVDSLSFGSSASDEVIAIENRPTDQAP